MGVRVACWGGIVALTLLGCGGGGDGDGGAVDAAPDGGWGCTLSGQMQLPFVTEVVDERLVVVSGNDRYPLEFGAWGNFGGLHGGHLEGDYKMNMTMHMLPADYVVELVNHPRNTGNGDGTCDPGEVCGATAAQLYERAPWYIARHEPMAMSHLILQDSNPAGLEGEFIDETMHWGFTLRACDDVYMTIGHMGALSSELLDILEARFGSAVRTAPETVDFSSLAWDHLPIPKGTVLGRPQLRSHYKDGDLHVASTVTEIDVNLKEATDVVQVCAFNHMSAADRQQLQRSMDLQWLDEYPLTAFKRFGERTEHNKAAVAQSVLCGSQDTIYGNYTRLDVEGSRAWKDALTTPDNSEVLSIFPIHRESRVMQEDWAKALFESPTSEYLMVRFIFNSNTTFSLTDDMGTVESSLVSGEILDLTSSQVEQATGSFTVRLDDSEIPFGRWIGQYQAASYRRTADRLIVHWGQLALTRDAVVVPPPITSDDVPCDGNPYRCYNHEYGTWWN